MHTKNSKNFGIIGKIDSIIAKIDKEENKDLRGIEKDLANWSRNEIPLKWNEEEINKAKKLYGDISVGIVYRGAKIHTQESYDFYQSIKDGGYIDCNLVSSTPDKEIALSFAQYIKSYDELTLMYALKTTLERGSAGAYGSVLLTLKPDPENVVAIINFEPEELKDHPSKRSFNRGAEPEVILHGKVKVLKAEIFDPLTEENYYQVFKILEPNQLNNDFIFNWLKHKKIKESGKYKEISKMLIEKYSRNEKDLIELLKSMSKTSFILDVNDILDNDKIIKYILNHSKLIPRNEEGWFVFDFPDEELNKIFNIPESFKKLIVQKYSKNVIKYMTELMNSFIVKDIGFSKMDFRILPVSAYEAINQLRWVVSFMPNILEYVSRTTGYLSLTQKLNEFHQQLLTIDCTNIQEKLKDLNFGQYPNLRNLGFALKHAALYYKILPNGDKMIKELIKHFYSDFFPKKYQPKRNEIAEYSSGISEILEISKYVKDSIY